MNLLAFQIGFVVTLLLGSLLGVFSLSLHRRTTRFLRRAQSFQGEVVEMIENGGEGAQSPVCTFTDASGRTRRFVSGVASYPPRYQVGQKVQVLHDEAAGETRLPSFFEMHGAAAVIAVLSAALFVASAIIFFGFLHLA